MRLINAAVDSDGTPERSTQWRDAGDTDADDDEDGGDGSSARRTDRTSAVSPRRTSLRDPGDPERSASLEGTRRPPRATARMKLLVPRADGSGHFMAADFELSVEGTLRWRAATKAEEKERAVVVRVRRRGEAALGIF